MARNTRNHPKRVFDALREVMTPPDPPKRSMSQPALLTVAF
jgi:hypothetical protein